MVREIIHRDEMITFEIIPTYVISDECLGWLLLTHDHHDGQIRYEGCFFTKESLTEEIKNLCINLTPEELHSDVKKFLKPEAQEE